MDEMEHIPRGDYAQNELRMYYWPLRMHSLGKKRKTIETKESILKRSIEMVKESDSNFKPHYDEQFFNLLGDGLK